MTIQAKQLRKDRTSAETRLWHRLRARRTAGYRFRRQELIPPQVADFGCFEAKLGVEVDGATQTDPARDLRSDRDLAEQGFRIIRLWNAARNLDGVLQRVLVRFNHPPPNPLPPDGRGTPPARLMISGRYASGLGTPGKGRT